MIFHKSFNLEDQKKFAEVSGDYNPIHLNPVKARRLIFGRVVVHGIHCVLWALDQWLNKKKTPLQLSQLEFTFYHAIGIKENINLTIEESSKDHTQFQIYKDGSIQMKLDCHWQNLTSNKHSLDELSPGEKICQKLSSHELKKAKGEIPLYLNEEKIKNILPSLTTYLPHQQIAILLASTRLVGMKCPGENSVYIGLDINFEKKLKDDKFNYETSLFNESLRLLYLKIYGNTFSGNIKTFVRPTEKTQMDFHSVTQQVSQSEYAGQRALVIGGSRGLGEMTVKMLCAGGAEVAFTYFQGSVEAKNIEKEINVHEKKVYSFPFDIENISNSKNQLDDLPFTPTHLYYYATPYIFLGNKETYQKKLYKRFHNYYVSAFQKVIDLLWHNYPSIKKVLYPSSIVLDAPQSDMKEYADAKKEGEILCHKLNNSNKNFKINICRFQRMPTDQTTTIINIPDQEILPHLSKYLNELKEM